MKVSVFNNRDVQCAADVGRMAELGRFAMETVIYGSAVQEKSGQIFYRMTTQEEALHSHIEQQKFMGNYYTPIISLRKREKVPFELHEIFIKEQKYSLARQMKQVYELSGYFECMYPFFQRESNNNSFPLLEDYKNKLEDYFDDTALQLFWGLVHIAFDKKVLSQDGFLLLEKWYKKIRKQMQDDSVVENNIERTFYGFVYLTKHGDKKYVYDTQLMPVIYKRQDLLMQECLCGAIMQKTFWFQQFNQMQNIRNTYIQWLSNAQNDLYFSKVKKINQLSGVVTQEELLKTLLKIKKYADAEKAAAYYFSIWNKK